jgi:hypothetical protein
MTTAKTPVDGRERARRASELAAKTGKPTTLLTAERHREIEQLLSLYEPRKPKSW